jgi:hypothetical protein
METQCEGRYLVGQGPTKGHKNKMIKNSQHKQKDDEFISEG